MPAGNAYRTLVGLAVTVAAGLAIGVFANPLLGGGGGDQASVERAAPAAAAPAPSTAPQGMAGMTNKALATAGMHGLGSDLPVVGGPHDADALLYPPAQTAPHPTGQVRDFSITASEKDIELAKGVHFHAWTFNGTVPGPIIRVTEGDLVRVKFTNDTTQPHSMHFHGVHPASQDGVEQVVAPGATFTYEFIAGPAGMHLYHCHAMPLKTHIHKGMYGAFIVDPVKPRVKAKEMVMLLNAFDVNGDSDNDLYGVNSRPFYFVKYPVTVKRNELVRIYVGNMTEFDAVNSFHLHGNLFKYYPTGTTPFYQYTDTVTLGQGERGVLEVRFPYAGRYMFHAHQTQLADGGWMGFFNVVN